MADIITVIVRDVRNQLRDLSKSKNVKYSKAFERKIIGRILSKETDIREKLEGKNLTQEKIHENIEKFFDKSNAHFTERSKTGKAPRNRIGSGMRALMINEGDYIYAFEEMKDSEDIYPLYESGDTKGKSAGEKKEAKKTRKKTQKAKGTENKKEKEVKTEEPKKEEKKAEKKEEPKAEAPAKEEKKETPKEEKPEAEEEEKKEK